MDEYVKIVLECEESSEIIAESSRKGKDDIVLPSVPETPAPSNIDGAVRRSARTRSKAAAAKKSEQEKMPVNTKAVTKKSPSCKGVWFRPDVQNDTAVLTKYLVESHTRSLKKIFRKLLNRDNTDLPSSGPSAVSGFFFINDDVVSHHGVSICDMTFYPFLHRTLETLGRTAASSSSFSSSEAKSRTMAIGAAIFLSTLSRDFREYNSASDGIVVLDAKLCSLAIMQLSDCLGSVICSAKTNGTLTTPSSGVTSKLVKLPDDILNWYQLNVPLEIEAKNENIGGTGIDFSTVSGSLHGAISCEGGNANSPTGITESSVVSGFEAKIKLRKIKHSRDYLPIHPGSTYNG